MESSAPDSGQSDSSHGLFSWEMLCLAWLPVLAIGAFHYSTGANHHWAHDVLRRLYYVPILFAAFSRGLRGGLALAVFSSLTYLPHAFFVMPAGQDPATTLNKILEVVLYNVIGILAGVMADREAERRRQVEQAFAEQRRMADQLVRAGRLAALGELVAGIAHEVKNPLHTIKGSAEIIDEIIPKDAEQASMWKLLRQEVDRLEGVAERFLSFARPSRPDLARVSFETIYRRCAELLQAQVRGESDVHLEISALSTDQSSVELEADRDQIAQVVLNIGGNALRAMNGKGQVALSGEVRNEGERRLVAIRLENDGPAIPVDDLERIFDPFYTRSKGGTGLGLAIAERIAEEHGGYLEAANTAKGRGVSFTVVLPAI